MSTNRLITLLNDIKLDKDTNLKPENLKKGVTLLGIQGALEGGITSGAKIFETVEAMQADPDAKEGDLAIVYRSEIQNATVDSKFQTATFPDTVVLDTAITNSIEVRYRAVDSSKMFDCWGSLGSSRFSMDCYTESGRIRIQYTSSDGVTYTRTDTTGNPVDFGTEIYYERAEMWNDTIGKFIQIGGSTFEGLYEYTEFNDKYFKLPIVDGAENTSRVPSSYDDFTLDFNKLMSVAKNYPYDYMDNPRCCIGKFDGKYYLLERTIKEGYYDGYVLGVVEVDSQKYSLSTRSTNPVSLIFNEIDLETYTITNSKTVDFNVLCSTYDGFNWYYNQTLQMDCLPIIFDNTNSFKPTTVYDNLVLNGTERTGYFTDNLIQKVPYNEYSIAPTQLSAIADYVYEKEFYGKNGVEVGTLGTPDNSFADTNAEIVYKIQNAYNDMEPRVLTDDDKTINTNIYFIPVKKDGTVLLDTSGVTNMTSMFNGCTNLTEIPLLDTSSVTTMQYMFRNCTNLTTIPLLNTSNVIDISAMFSGCKNLTTIPLLDTSRVTTMYQVFYGCTNLTEIPLLDTSRVTTMLGMFNNCTNLTTIPLLNTSKVTDIHGMFYGCENLTTIPLLNTSKVTDMENMFKNCTSLSDESLNNILAMCKNASKITSNKTLKYIGLTSEQANKCKTLSNYSAFTSAGWTTGY